MRYTARNMSRLAHRPGVSIGLCGEGEGREDERGAPDKDVEAEEGSDGAKAHDDKPQGHGDDDRPQRGGQVEELHDHRLRGSRQRLASIRNKRTIGEHRGAANDL